MTKLEVLEAQHSIMNGEAVEGHIANRLAGAEFELPGQRLQQVRGEIGLIQYGRH